MSMASFVQLFEWLSDHPVIAALLVFVIALSESLAIVGLIVPGIFFMVVFGALITTGYLDFGWTVVAAILGAIAGDGLSYWLGRRYQQQFRNLWPFRRHPGLLDRGVAFFHRHGGKSVLLGRFVGPLRPVIPAVAGMLEMPRNRFLLTNVGSALLWGPIILLPGMAFGLSLELAAEFAGRLSLVLIILLLLLWLVFWIIRQAYFFAAPRTDELFSHVINWINRHPLVGRVPAALIDPRHPEMRVLTLLGGMLLLASIALSALSQFLTEHSLILGLSELIYYQLQQLHNPPIDRLMLFFSALGNDLFLTTLTLILVLWAALHRNWLAVWHMLAALVLPLIVVHTLQFLFAVPRPDITASHTTLDYPGAHITLATAVYGFIAVVLTRDMPAGLRSVIYICAASLVLLIGFARLYLGVHWLSDVLGGILLGLIWVSLLGIGYRRHLGMPPLPIKTLSYPLILIAVLLVIYPFSQSDQGVPDPLDTRQHYRLSLSGWQQSGWQALAHYRSDLLQQRKYPLNLQWSGQREQIKQHLLSRGWELHTGLNPGGWLQSGIATGKLPVIPHLHEGRYEMMRFARVDTRHERLLTLRLWPTDLYIQHADREQPLWIGEVSYLQAREFGPVQYMRTTVNFNQALDAFLAGQEESLMVARHRSEGFVIALIKARHQSPPDA